MSEGVTTTHRVSFPVSDVTPGNERLREIAVCDSIERTVQSKVLTCASAKQKVAEIGDFHPLIAAAAIAHKRHYPLTLSPDMIWLTVLQGVAQHIANHSDSLRSRLVPHLTKIELIVDSRLSALPETDVQMKSLTQEFVNSIRKHALPDKGFLWDTEFSTTTDVERIVGAVVLMDAFQPYFDYVFTAICGIPSVVLEGNTADWELLASKVRSLHESDLELSWWTKHLLPLCEHFVRASRGDVDRKHWGNLCKLVKRYGYDDLNGWLLKFIPYVRRDRNEIPQLLNPVLELTEYPTEGEGMEKITGCTSGMLPSGLSNAPVTCKNLISGESTQYEFVAGFTGVTQSPQDFGVRPAIGWAITEGKGIDRVITRIRLEHHSGTSEKPDLRKLTGKFRHYLPADVWRFYTELGSARIDLRKPNKWGEMQICINPLAFVDVLWDFRVVEEELRFLVAHKLISSELYDDRKEFNFAYSRLVHLGQSTRHGKRSYYVFGRDPEVGNLKGEKKASRGEIFRWTGERRSSAFTPVARTFAEWLAELLGS